MNAPVEMVSDLIYGKIIIDDIKLNSGEIVQNVLGGGGPQAAFGARLWSDSVGFLSRSGADIEEEHIQTLHDLDIDISGYVRFPNHLTARTRMFYDENEYILTEGGQTSRIVITREDFLRLLAEPLSLPDSYKQPRLIHLITEFTDEPMAHTALELREQGAIFSWEPLIDYREWSNRQEILAFVPKVDVISPDWPAASGIAGSDDPLQVMKYWAKLGARMVTVRHGHHGSYAWDRDHDQVWHIPATPVEVIDVTGAGNSYGGGACVGWAETGDAKLAGCYGAVSAWFLVGRVGLPKWSPALRQQARQLLEQTLDNAREL